MEKNPPYKFKWTEKTVPVTEGSSETTPEGYTENYRNVPQEIRDQLNDEAEAVKIILTWIDNDIYSTVDACPNASEMWIAIERFYKMMNELVKNQYDVTNHQVNVQFLLQLQPEWQRFVTLVKQSQELKSVSYHKLYDILKQHQYEVNEIRAERITHTANPLALEYGHVAKECQKPKRAKDAAYHKEKMLLYKQEEAGFQFKKLLQMLLTILDPILILILAQRYKKEDHYNVIANNGEHPEQPKSVNDTYLEEQGDTNITIDSLDMSTNGETVDQDDDDLANERDLLATLIDKLNVKLMTTKTFLKKAQRANPRLYDIGCYNDNLALILAPDSNETIRLAQESRSKLSDLIRPFNYEKLNNLFDLFIPQREKSPEQQYFLESADLEKFHSCLKEEMVVDLRYFNSLENEVDFLKSQMETQRTQFLNEINRLSREYYFADHMNAILGVYTTLDEFTDLQYLEVAFRKFACYIHDLKGNDLLTAISSQAWLWHRRLSHLNFDTINLLSKYDIVIGLPKLKFIKDHLCSSCEYTWTHLLRSKDETPKVLINFLTFVQRGLHAQVRTVRTDKGYSTQSRAYRVFNKRTRVIVETIHVNFDELPQMASDRVSSDPVPQCPTTELEHDSLTPIPQSQENVPHAAETVCVEGRPRKCCSDSPIMATQNTTQSTTITVAADIPPLNIQTSPETTSQAPTQAPTITATENINQAETNKENAQVEEDEFINIFLHRRHYMDSNISKERGNDDSPTSEVSKGILKRLGSTEAPPFVSSLEEQISLISSNEAVESIQEDSIDFDGNTLITPYDCLTFKEAE
ncbi:retrovirus-related pol polyprotein from transposon TNT 1-94 [Tanacetum coccineum]